MYIYQLLNFLFRRPIGVLMSFLALAILSILAAGQLPISLLPPIDVPQLLIQVDYPGHSPTEVEQNVLSILRAEMLTLNGISAIESEAYNQRGRLRLAFNFGTRMRLAYMEANEKLDRLLSSLPRDLERPNVIKINTNDIPLVRLQITPQSLKDAKTSELVTRVIKKQMEGIPGVSLVDMNGQIREQITISPREDISRSLQITENQILELIRSANQPLSSISVRDGQYRYWLQSSPLLRHAGDIAVIPVRLPGGGVLPLGEIAEIRQEAEVPEGYHLFWQAGAAKDAFVFALYKQPSAKMQEVIFRIENEVKTLEKKYPNLKFQFTQSQYTLLDVSIQNLRNTLLLGAAGVVMVIFLFLGSWRMSLVIACTLPLSLLLGMGLFYLTGLTINIISLSGMALGLGMLIDNSIIILDNMTRFLSEGKDRLTACVMGVQDVIAPLLSSTLTTLSVFVPLVFISGISGALFYDQAVSIAIILFSSLFVAFLFLPHLFLLAKSKNVDQKNILYQLSVKLYDKAFGIVWRRQKLFLLLFSLGIFTPFWLWRLLPVEGLPLLSKSEQVLQINWNRSIDIEQNNKKTLAYLHQINDLISLAEIDIGEREYLLDPELSTPGQAHIFLEFSSPDARLLAQKRLADALRQHDPEARFSFMAPPDAFSQLFPNTEQREELRIRQNDVSQVLSPDKLQRLYDKLSAILPTRMGAGTATETQFAVSLDTETAAVYGISEGELIEKVKQQIGQYPITYIQAFGQRMPILLQLKNKENFDKILHQTILTNGFPLSDFVRLLPLTSYRSTVADAQGIYQSFTWPMLSTEERQAVESALPPDLQTDWEGGFEENKKNMNEIIFVLFIAVILLYFILVAQFESFLQPLIVLLSLPLGIAGALAGLYLGGYSLNLMSGIGLIVMLGIMVNDTILKIDTINKLKLKSTLSTPFELVHRAGILRLRPILMTTFTTILAVLPTLFGTGIGAELQAPLVVALVSGLLVGTLSALFFVPLAYRVTL